MQKREWKVAWLKIKGIELFAFPTPWVVGKRALPDQLFYDELHLSQTSENYTYEGFGRTSEITH